MSITSISYDWGVEPTIIRVTTTSTLATITTSGFWTLAATVAAIETLNNGAFDVPEGSLFLINYSNGEGFFTLNTSTNAFVAETVPGALSETLPDGDIFVGDALNIATGVTPSGDITLTNTGVFGIATGAIVNADVNAAAAIAYSKLAALPSAEILVGSGANVATAVAVTGDVTISNAGVTAIAADSIVNADVNSAAAIAFSKLAALPSAELLVGSAGNVPTAVAMSGDVAIDNAGATTIQAGAIDLAMLSAGITPSSVIKFAGKENNGGGSATIAITQAGVLTSDIVFAQVQASTNAVSVQKVTPTADTVTVLLSADPGAATVISWQVLRAAS